MDENNTLISLPDPLSAHPVKLFMPGGPGAVLGKSIVNAEGGYTEPSVYAAAEKHAITDAVKNGFHFSEKMKGQS
ncbi:hypothetical protein C0995_007826 [Termitomyces sp. Mi166|nr:hypothetical protein C0995_007826 [Termitomyces sp. Mi166\